MILLLSALILTSPRTQPPAPEIAYSARFFAEGKKQSYYHIYISRSDGTHRRQLTFGNRSHFSPIWVDRNHLAWSEFDDPVTESMDWDKLRTIRIVRMNIFTGRQYVVGRIQSKNAYVEVDILGRTIYIGDVVGKYSKYTSFRVTTNGMVPGNDEFNWQLFGKRTGTFEKGLFWRGSVPVPGSKIPYNVMYGPWKEEQESFEVTFERKGTRRKFTFSGDDLQSVILDKDGSLLAKTGRSFNKFDNGEFLYRIDFEKGTVTTVLRDIGSITLFRDNAHWAGNQAETRPLAPLLKNGKPTPHQVWVNYLYAGNWKTGRRYWIAEGVVNVRSFQLSTISEVPERNHIRSGKRHLQPERRRIRNADPAVNSKSEAGSGTAWTLAASE